MRGTRGGKEYRVEPEVAAGSAGCLGGDYPLSQHRLVGRLYPKSPLAHLWGLSVALFGAGIGAEGAHHRTGSGEYPGQREDRGQRRQCADLSPQQVEVDRRRHAGVQDLLPSAG